ncbi:MAG: CatA-like O-acetyltransferase [Oscillospiraceae bacterium]
MKFNIIDMDNWGRKTHFLHYYKDVKCTYNITCNIDITPLYNRAKAQGAQLYPTLIWLVSQGVNTFDFMRFAKDEQGRLGYYQEVNPSFTSMPHNSENFSCLWTEYSPDFKTFYENCTGIIERYSDTKEMIPQVDTPVNCFDISSIPWIEFTGFNLNLHTDGSWLLPIFTTGKLIIEGEKVSLPFSIQVHHSVCDGFHCAKFLEHLQQHANNPQDWLNLR